MIHCDIQNSFIYIIFYILLLEHVGMSVSSFAVSKRKDYTASTTTLKAIITQAAITITLQREEEIERQREKGRKRQR